MFLLDRAMLRCEGRYEQNGQGSFSGCLLRFRVAPGAVCGDERVSLFRSPAVALVGANPVVVLEYRINYRPGGLNRVLTAK
jgi:hypothetical protein